jgi:hypothetical protein
MKKKFVFAVSLGLLLTQSVLAERGGSSRVGGGGDTYITQMYEAKKILVSLFRATAEIHSRKEDLNQAFREHREKWLQAIDRVEFERSIEELTDQDGDRRVKALIANRETGIVKLSVPYWEKHPVSLVQSVVAAIHETGHLADVPLGHEELDELGLQLVKEKLSDYFGTEGLKKISSLSTGNSPYESLKMLYEDAPEVARLEDMSLYSVGKARKCSLSRQTGFPTGPLAQVYFDVHYEDRSEHGPLFGGEKIGTVLFNGQRRLGTWTHPRRSSYSSRITARGYVVNGLYNISLDPIGELWRQVEISFRRSADLVAFQMKGQEGAVTYGYCWLVELAELFD